MAVRIPKELADALGTSTDPAAFYRACFRKMSSPMRELMTRATGRLGVTHVDTPSQADPKRKHRIGLVPKASDGVDQLGLRFAMLAFKVPRGAETLADEARRMAMGLKRGLEGDVEVDRALLPPMHPHAARFLEGDPAARSLFGVDDAILLGILAAAVPVLIALIPFMLPMLIDAGNMLFETIGSSVKIPGITAPSVAEEKAAAEAAAARAAQDQSKKRNLMIAAAVLVVVLGGVAYYRSRQAG